MDPDAPPVSFNFVHKGVVTKVDAFRGQNLLRVAQKNDVALEGACECSVACSTCHVILPDDLFDALPEATDEEEDMLDLAWGLEETSRLGCQLELSESFQDAIIKVPDMTRNFYVDGHVPTPH